MERITLQVGSFAVNCSFLIDGSNAWIIDPGQESPRLLAVIRERGLTLRGILLTHAHFDHIGGIPDVQAAYPDVAVFVHANDVPAFTHPANQMPPDYPAIAAPKHVVAFPVGQRQIEGLPHVTIIETPGHTPGGVCYYLPAMHPAQAPILFSGDTLFAGSVGRTDFPGGDMATLMRSLEALKALPPETVVIPGHGPFTTIGDECAGNPFLQ